MAGVMTPFLTSVRRACWEDSRWAMKDASHFPTSLTATRSRRPLTPALREGGCVVSR